MFPPKIFQSTEILDFWWIFFISGRDFEFLVKRYQSWKVSQICSSFRVKSTIILSLILSNFSFFSWTVTLFLSLLSNLNQYAAWWQHAMLRTLFHRIQFPLPRFTVDSNIFGVFSPFLDSMINDHFTMGILKHRFWNLQNCYTNVLNLLLYLQHIVEFFEWTLFVLFNIISILWFKSKNGK